ncbi:MAG: hypothetical protein K1X58_12450, partial [Flavobacteriales bacterium]|nr:hypothetical protein [Flavobacteriales bacterium]
PTAPTDTTKTMTAKLNNDNGLQQLTDRRPTGNMRLASCGVKCLNSSAVFQINFSAGLTVLCPEIPHERQAQKRYKSGMWNRQEWRTDFVSAEEPNTQKIVCPSSWTARCAEEHWKYPI